MNSRNLAQDARTLSLRP